MQQHAQNITHKLEVKEAGKTIQQHVHANENLMKLYNIAFKFLPDINTARRKKLLM